MAVTTDSISLLVVLSAAELPAGAAGTNAGDSSSQAGGDSVGDHRGRAIQLDTRTSSGDVSLRLLFVHSR